MNIDTSEAIHNTRLDYNYIYRIIRIIPSFSFSAS